MIKIEQSVVINRPVEEVFAYLSKAENATNWQSGVLQTIEIGFYLFSDCAADHRLGQLEEAAYFGLNEYSHLCAVVYCLAQANRRKGLAR